MAEPACEGCRERDARNAELERRVERLEAQVRELLGRNASNSSVPPSANPPQAPKPVVKTPTGRQPGAQPGHEPHLRCRLPVERVQQVVDYIPKQCQECRAPLPQHPGPADPEPTWHQVAELPEIRADITEHRGHARTCRCCGAVTRSTIPAEVRAHSIGPKLTATLSYLSGRHHLSKRGVEEVAEAVFDVPVALGTISNLEQEMSQALAAAHAEVAEAVHQVPVKNVDETGWKQAGKTCWLWTAVTGTAVLFVIHAKRSVLGLTMLLGETIQGVISSDRWSVYGKLPLARRQICWAHLRRDFQAMVDRGGSAGKLGEELLAHTEVLFDMWYKVRDGTRGRRWLQRLLAELRPEIVELLRRGTRLRCAKTAGTCREILGVEAALWTFAQVAGVEPTNNAAERALRPAVLWRKRSFGCWSEDGCRFVERLLTVLHTLRAQQGQVLDYLTEAVVTHRAGLPTPPLLASG